MYMHECMHVQKMHGSRARDPPDFYMAEIHCMNLRKFRVTQFRMHTESTVCNPVT